MGIVTDLLDEQQQIANTLIRWHDRDRNIAKYVLPQTEGFDRMIQSNPTAAADLVATLPIAADRSKDVYDMTSIVAIERLSAGLLSLKTPETATWHDLAAEDEYSGGDDLSHEAKTVLERLRDYLFKVRNNPASGFWPAHRAAVRSMCAFGDGWMFTPEAGGPKTPWRYEYLPLSEVFAAVDHTGRPSIMHRPFSMSAVQIVGKWGDKAGAKVLEHANDPKKCHTPFKVMQSVRPRASDRRSGLGVRGSAFESHYILPEEKHHIGEGGYYEFPFHRYSWSQSGMSARSYGPVDLALGEIKSLQELARNELIAANQHTRPPLATYGKKIGRLNFNPGFNNQGLISAEGRPLFAPLTAGQRPDFAQAVIEARRNAIRETLYLNLWQILIEQPEKTATEAMIRAQEKGELLGPVGISLNFGLSTVVDREIMIMQRKGAFDQGMPFEMPEELHDKDVVPEYTSPLDKLRRMGELMGVQRLAAMAGELFKLTGKKQAVDRLDIDEMLEMAQDILGAPVTTLKDREEGRAADQQQQGMEQLMGLLETMKGGGDAARAVGEGSASLTQAAELAKATGNTGAPNIPGTAVPA